MTKFALYRHRLDNAPADDDFIETADMHMVIGMAYRRAWEAGMAWGAAQTIANDARRNANL